MTKLSMTENSMKRCLVDMPYVVLFEIFRRLHGMEFSKLKLIRISQLCSKFRDVAGDTRFWKNVYIKYNPGPTYKKVAYEELYSVPAKVIDLSHTWIKRPVYLQIDQVVKVKELNLSSIITADKCTMEAILAKYQCTKLHLNFDISLNFKGEIMDIAPETFLKLSALEVLKVVNNEYLRPITITTWLAKVLTNCKQLKTLDLSYTNHSLHHYRKLSLVKSMPTSLEKLVLKGPFPEDSFFESLSEISPNLRELGLPSGKILFPSLLKFQFLETLRITLQQNMNIDRVYMYLISFPALKTVHVDDYEYLPDSRERANLEELEEKMKPHGIKIVGPNEAGPELVTYDYWVPSLKRCVAF